MKKPDEGHVLTDQELEKLEHRIASVYRQASDELKETIDAYFASFAKRDEKMKSLIGTKLNGQIWTEEDYKLWRLAQIGRGERFIALRDKIAQRMTEANEVAVAYSNDTTPGIYSLNRNYIAYSIDTATGGKITLPHGAAGGVDFTLWDEQTVKRLIVEKPDLMPYYPEERALKRGIDLEFGKKQITKTVTSGILQGKSIPQMAKDLRLHIASMNQASAVRAARTATTAAENAGRQDGFIAAEKMGIKCPKRWIATKDNKTRHDHGVADGQVVDAKEPFIVGGFKMMFPCDKSMGAPGHEIYCCRCSTAYVQDKRLEAEPRKMRVQTPEYIAALESEEKERERYKRVSEQEQLEKDPVKKAKLAKKREQLQKSLASLEKERKKTPKTVVVNEMTFTEWQDWVKKSNAKRNND